MPDKDESSAKKAMNAGYVPFSITFTKTLEVTVMARSKEEARQAAAREARLIDHDWMGVPQEWVVEEVHDPRELFTMDEIAAVKTFDMGVIDGHMVAEMDFREKVRRA
jgi:hypothetical protein